MILTADVAKLKCIYFNTVNLLVASSNYGIDCKKNDNQELLDTVYKYLTLLELSGTMCRSLECKIIEILDANIPPTACVRNVVTITAGGG